MYNRSKWQHHARDSIATDLATEPCRCEHYDTVQLAASERQMTYYVEYIVEQSMLVTFIIVKMRIQQPYTTKYAIFSNTRSTAMYIV